MRKNHIRSLAAILLIIIMASPGMQGLGGSSGGDRASRGPGPMDASTVWTDSFDDTSHVYIPTGGLVGVEVSGGEVTPLLHPLPCLSQILTLI